jgi:hypothetical protein
MVLAVVVWLPVWYVGSWIAVARLTDAGFISLTTAKMVRPAFVPIQLYCESTMPGAETLTQVYWSVNPPDAVFAAGFTARRSQILEPNRR